MRNQYEEQLRQLNESLTEMGDLCEAAIGKVNEALKGGQKVIGEIYELETHVHMEAMSNAARAMVTKAVSAYVNQDLDMAREVMASDDTVDGLFDEIKNELIALIAQHPDEGEACLDLLMVAKYLERIGDHTTNIAEWVEFSITGVRPESND